MLGLDSFASDSARVLAVTPRSRLLLSPNSVSLFFVSKLLPSCPESRRLVRDIAEIAGGGDEHRAECGNNRAAQAKNRMGRKTREALGLVATADGGLELEVSDDLRDVEIWDRYQGSSYGKLWLVDPLQKLQAIVERSYIVFAGRCSYIGVMDRTRLYTSSEGLLNGAS